MTPNVTPPKPRSGLGGGLAAPSSPDRPQPPETGSTSRSRLRGLIPRRRSRGTAPDETPEPLASRWSSGHRLATNALRAGLAGVLVLAVAYPVYDTLTETEVVPQAGAELTDVHQLTSRRMVASEAALAWVESWITGTDASRERLTGPAMTEQVVLPAAGSKISNARVVDASPTAPGVWSVTVTGIVTDPGGEPARRYYLVPVQVAGEEVGQITATAQEIPAIVPGPRAFTAPLEDGSYGQQIPPGTSAGTTITQFLTALLVGEGDIDRVTTPGTRIAKLPPQSRYRAVDVVEIQSADSEIDWRRTPPDGRSVHVLVEATVTTDEDAPGTTASRSVTYPLQLTARDGRWEITSIDRSLTHETPSPTGEDTTTGGTP